MQDWLEHARYTQTVTFKTDLDSMDDETRIQYLKDMILAATDELHEALGEIGWKPWATSRHINREAFVGELVDVGHFLANLLVGVGVDDDEWAAAYHEKATRNKARQEAEGGYTGLDKCPECKRAIDDVLAHQEGDA